MEIPETKEERVRRLKNEAKRRYRKRIREWYTDMKSHLTCRVCGDLTARIEFHHNDPSTKLFNVSNMIGCESWSKIKAEIAKCSPVCQSCHEDIHEGNIDWMIKYPNVVLEGLYSG